MRMSTDGSSGIDLRSRLLAFPVIQPAVASYTRNRTSRVIHSYYYRVFSDGKSGDWIGEMLSTFPQSKMNIY